MEQNRLQVSSLWEEDENSSAQDRALGRRLRLVCVCVCVCVGESWICRLMALRKTKMRTKSRVGFSQVKNPLISYQLTSDLAYCPHWKGVGEA